MRVRARMDTRMAVIMVMIVFVGGLRRIERAFFGGTAAGRISDLDLYRRVTDAESRFQCLLNLGQKVVAGVAGRHHEVNGQGNIRGAHRPDVKVMDPRHARYSLQGGPDLPYRD